MVILSIHINMNRGLKIAGWIGLGIAALFAVLLVVATTFDWNRVKPWINDNVSEATGRSFAINGDLSLSWERPAHAQHGLQSILPWPHFRARDVQLGNPDWAKTGPTMASVQQVDFTLELLPLLRKSINVNSLLLTEPQLNLEAGKDDRNNWTFPKKEDNGQSAWEFNIRDLAITRGDVRYLDPAKDADAKIRIDTFDDGSVAWKLGGTFNDEKLSGGGKAGALLTLRTANVRYPLEAEIKVGETTITADGSITNPTDPKALDINLKILGASMADLFPLSGVVLPETPKFSTEGRVVGSLEPGRFHLSYRDFKGKVGASDLGGTFEYQQQEPRPILRGKVVSNYLNVKDLGPLIGVGDQQEQDEEEKTPPGKVLPVSRFKTERWDKMDVDVEFTGKKIVHTEELPIDNLHVEISMKNGVLALAPLNFGVAGGRLKTELSIDGRRDPAAARLQMSARGLKLKELFPKIEEMQASIGQINGDAKLSAAGNSVAALLAATDGEIKALINQGSISKFILEAMGLNIGSIVVTKLFGDRQVPLNCMVADFNVKNGVMRANTFVADTADATIVVKGNIDFAEEQLDLTIHPESKGVRLISLRSPLYVNGTFKNPEVGIDKGVVAAKAGAAAVLGAVAAPLAGLLALVNPGPGEDSPCGALLAQAKEKPDAPPPNPSPKSEQKTQDKE